MSVTIWKKSLQVKFSEESRDEVNLDGGGGLNPMTVSLEEGQVIQKEGHMKTEAEIGVMQPQAVEHRELPEVGRRKNSFFCRGFDATDCLILDFWLLEP